MVSPDTAVRRLLKETATLLERYEFHGTDPAWTRTVDGGLARIGRTRLARTWTGGQQTRSFALTLDVTPTPWWEYLNWRNTRAGLPPLPWADATGPGLIDPRPRSGDFDTPWVLRADPNRSGSHALPADIDSIRAQLPRRVHACARRALQLLEPGRYLDELLARTDPEFPTCEAIVVLLAADGPGARLDDAVERLRRCTPQVPSDRVAEVVRYARHRAETDRTAQV